jgi:hypothetical protein
MTDKLNIVLVHGGNRAFAETDECRFSFPMSSSDPLTGGDASCLTPCHLRFVSDSCHFFGALHGVDETAGSSFITGRGRGSLPPAPAATGPANKSR